MTVGRGDLVKDHQNCKNVLPFTGNKKFKICCSSLRHYVGIPPLHSITDLVLTFSNIFQHYFDIFWLFLPSVWVGWHYKGKDFFSFLSRNNNKPLHLILELPDDDDDFNGSSTFCFFILNASSVLPESKKSIRIKELVSND